MARTKGALGKKTLAKNGMSKPTIIKPAKTGKRGRPRKEKTFNNVGVITQAESKTEYTPEIYTTDVKKVEKLNQLTGNFRLMVSGDNYLDAINQAKNIMLENGYKIQNYFEQIAFRKSIVIGYNKE